MFQQTERGAVAGGNPESLRERLIRFCVIAMWRVMPASSQVALKYPTSVR